MKWLKQSTTLLLTSTLLLGVGTSQAENLTSAVNDALSTNPEVKSALSNRFAKDQEVRQAFAGYLPVVDLSAGAGTYQIQKPDIDPDNLSPQEMTLSLRQNVFAGMATINEVERQEARVQSAAYSLQATADRIALQTSKAYLDVLRNQELLSLAQKNLLNHQRIADQVSLRGSSGVGNTADTNQIQGRVSLAQSNVIVTQTNLIDSQNNYFAVVGHTPGHLDAVQPVDKSMPSSLQHALEQAKTNHPALNVAGADLEARRKQHNVAKSAFFPVVDIEIDQNWDNDVDGFEGDQNNLTAMVKLRYNLFNGFSDQARKLETTQLVNEAQELKHNTSRQVVESMQLSWNAYQAEQSRMKYLTQHVESSKATLNAYQKQFDLGKRTLLDVLDTEAEVITSKKDLVNASYDRLYAQFRVLNGMGNLVPSLGVEWPEGTVAAEEKKIAEAKKAAEKANAEKESKAVEAKKS